MERFVGFFLLGNTMIFLKKKKRKKPSILNVASFHQEKKKETK